MSTPPALQPVGRRRALRPAGAPHMARPADLVRHQFSPAAPGGCGLGLALGEIQELTTGNQAQMGELLPRLAGCSIRLAGIAPAPDSAGLAAGGPGSAAIERRQ